MSHFIAALFGTIAEAPQVDLTATDTAFKWFWTVAVFASLAWYAILLFWLGAKGGIEIRRMTRVLSGLKDQAAAEPDSPAVDEGARR
jgi:hypothetical protein